MLMRDEKTIADPVAALHASRRISAALEPEQRDFLRVLGHAYLQHGQADGALPLFQLLVATDARDVHAGESLACTLLHMQRPDEAVRVLDPLIAGDLATPLCWLLRAQALTRLGRLSEANRSMRIFAAVRDHERLRRAG